MASSTHHTSSGRFAFALTLVVLGALVVSAMVAPVVHHALETSLERHELRFSRVFARLAIIFLIVGLIVARRSMGFSRLASAWREESWRERGVRLAIGAALSLGPALLVLTPAIHHSALGWAGRTWLQAAAKIVEGIPSALLAGTVEEAFFRVLVFGGLAATWDWRVAAIASSAFYAVVHFLTPDATFVLNGTSPAEGLRYVAGSIERLVDPATTAAVFGLLLIGLVLSTAYHRRRSLALLTGLHMGWFLAAKAAVRMSHLPPELADDASRIKRMLLIGSPWLWLAVVVTWVAVMILTHTRRRDD